MVYNKMVIDLESDDERKKPAIQYVVNMWPAPTKPGTSHMGLFWVIGHWNFKAKILSECQIWGFGVFVIMESYICNGKYFCADLWMISALNHAFSWFFSINVNVNGKLWLPFSHNVLLKKNWMVLITDGHISRYIIKREMILVSNESWKSGPSNKTYNSIYVK